jgi:hypothetical protein
MLDAAGRQQRHLQLLQRRVDAQVCRPGEIRPAAIAGPARAVINNLIRFRPAHRGAWRPRLLAALPARAALAPFPPRRPPAWQVISRRRHRGVAAIPAQAPPQLRDLCPQLLHRPPKLRDHLIPGGARRASGSRRRQIGHKPP